ncbi:helix-turn-helix domain-containing protein [Paenibacillus marinisediminis]
MTAIRFTLPPMPNFIVSGQSTMSVGDKHFARRGLSCFDLLYVISGCLYMGEEDREFEVREGHALILRPDAYHYGSKPCTEDTKYIWLHFLSTGNWSIVPKQPAEANIVPLDKRDSTLSNIKTRYFTAEVPAFSKVDQPTLMTDMLQQLTEYQHLEQNNLILWKQQALFQDVLMQLAASDHSQTKPLASQCAELAAAYMRQHYKEEITAQDLGVAVNFHPVYIARCMKQVFGCSPMQYLHNYRLERAKLLLIQSDSAIVHIAEEVGFQSAAYFTASFSKYEGISPRLYRQRFR